MGRAIQAIMAQAPHDGLTTYKADLAARGLGFTPDDLAAIAAAGGRAPATRRASGDPAADAGGHAARDQEMVDGSRSTP